MIITRLSKTAFVAAIALFASLVAFGNITDYGNNFAGVQHVMAMDEGIAAGSSLAYRAISNPALHHLAYGMIIAAETAVALLCWFGAAIMLKHLRRPARAFNRAKAWAIAGLALGFLTWQVAFMSVGAEWFGMWMSPSWNATQSAFRIFITIIAVLIFVVLPDGETDA